MLDSSWRTSLTTVHKNERCRLRCWSVLDLWVSAVDRWIFWCWLYTESFCRLSSRLCRCLVQAFPYEKHVSSRCGL
jgi:hypothetical protein